ncbi:hypothetical protein B0H98_107204 [Vreelandella songnenensis]|uniref:Uncharacterized protein n=1 Tax=Vreelandella songnenensis TaxID=1176243 RepID=A0A2T0V1X0_9GAMM|nr:hypothetical protein [Halomonas songnenensis]PRY64058.1 hypothetical protein B0H98_107204 [Halomonas songnenensis]
MWFVQPKQDYISQIPWKYTDEPAVVSWQVRARNYNTFVANILLSVLMVFYIGLAYISSLMAETLLFSLLLGFGMYFLLILIAMSMTHQTSILVYRFTGQHAEECSWKPQMEALKPFLKWLAIISMPIVLVLILMDPSLLITSLGPLLMGFAAWMMGTSKGYQELHGMQHHDYDWRKADKVYLYPGRDIIGLNVPWYHPEMDEMIPEGIREIYCKKGERDKVLGFLTSNLPDIEIVEEKFHL